MRGTAGTGSAAGADSTGGMRYDRIGLGYSVGRRADPTWAAAIARALGDAAPVLNVGAGAGSYEPTDRPVVALEPSELMITQRPADAAHAVRGVAELLPFTDRAAAAVLAVLSNHHWSDEVAGFAEMCRVAPLRVVLTFDPVVHMDQWIIRDYVPEVAALDTERPPFDETVGLLSAEVTVLPVTRSCEDGVLGAYWCRPYAYLDPVVRAHMSGFARLDPAIVERGVRRLRADLESGAWETRYGSLAELESFDAGFRLLVSRDDS
jgi:SAM-dependent methyltransferase